MIVIPAVDILDGTVVRLRQGNFDARTVYGPNPAAQVSEFGRLGADLVHVVDLDGARTGRSSPGLWEAIGQTGVPFQAGGGIRTAEDAARVTAAGASRVVVGTAAVWHRSRLDEIISAVEGSRVVVALDVRDGRVHGWGWEDEGRVIAEVFDEVAAADVTTVLVTSVVRDGTLDGPDFDLLAKAALYRDWKVIASGGIGGLEDVARLATRGLWGAVVGRALYDQAFSLSDAFAAAGAANGPLSLEDG